MLYRTSTRLIKYGPLCWAEGPEEDLEDGVNMFTGNYPIGVDKNGIPIDEEGNQLLDKKSIFHPDSTISFRPATLRIEMEVPDISEVHSWIKDHHLAIDEKTIQKYIILAIMKRNGWSDAWFLACLGNIGGAKAFYEDILLKRGEEE
jgi:hypothetical protein